MRTFKHTHTQIDRYIYYMHIMLVASVQEKPNICVTYIFIHNRAELAPFVGG